MGTKHGYTEKKCSMCGKMKPREAYPKRGGLACTECQKPERRKEQKERYDREMKTEPGRARYRKNQQDYRDRQKRDGGK